MHMIPSAQTLFAFARTLQGDELETLNRKKRFTVEVIGNTLEFTPIASSQPRKESLDRVEAMLAIVKASGEPDRSKLTEISFNSSYVLALLSRWQSEHA
jgi:hypothetical protein